MHPLVLFYLLPLLCFKRLNFSIKKHIDSEIYAYSWSSFTWPATTNLSLYQNRKEECGDNVTSLLLMDEFQSDTDI